MRSRDKNYYLRAFLIVFGACLLCLVPIMIINGGRFFYYGDFNKQQITFYTRLHDMVRNGGLTAWDPLADLGSDTVAAYSFYLLGSPFFWLTIPLPSSWVVSAIPVLIALKSGLAALGAYGFVNRLCRSKDASLIAAVLYGLSAYNSANLIFNHFHDAVLMLPFMLWALEALINDGRYGLFALTVGLGAVISYYFFFGQAIFLILYFVCALITGHFRLTPRRFAQLAFEAVVGVMLAAVILLPSAMSVINNPRVSEHLSGSGLFLYESGSIYLFILKNLLLLPDITLINNFGMTTGQASGSFASFIPFFSLCGVIAYFRCRKGKDHIKLLLAVSGVMMLVPVLNQSFSFWTPMFYGRWFYMPVLIACAATAGAVEDGELKKGFVPTAVITGLAAAASLTVTLLAKNGVLSLGFDNYSFAYVQAVFTVASVAAFGMLLCRPQTESGSLGKPLLTRTAVFAAAGMMLTVGCSYVFRGTSESDRMNNVFDYKESGDTLGSEQDGFFRVSTEGNLRNMPVLWGYPTVRYFNSTVEPTIIEFYNALGLERTVRSDFEPTEYPLMALLSVKYYIDEAYYDDNGDPLPAAEKIAGTADSYKLMYQKNELNFYENEEYIPMGMAFDRYTDNRALEGQPTLMKGFAYLEALVLDDEQKARYGDILTGYDTEDIATAGERYREICAERREKACSEFEMQGSEFTAKISLDKPMLVFFSVPYSEGWSAEVNGEEARIEKVDNGMMAVLCGAGESEILFKYSNGSITVGAIVSAAAGLLLAGGMAARRKLRRKE